MSRFVPTPFARSLLSHARRWRALRDHGDPDVPVSPMWSHWTDGIWPETRDLAARVLVEDRVRAHSHLAALHSSMAFGFNLFLPFRAGADLAPALAPLVGPMAVDKVAFEWIPPGHILGEIDGDTPRGDEAATGVDVVVHGHRADGSRIVILIEVKLSEGGFSTCNGRTSRANQRTDICDSATAFLADPSSCYLRRPRRQHRDRRYWEIFNAEHGDLSTAFPGTPVDGPCPFAGDAQQPMRQYALALGLEQEGFADEAWLLLAHHDHNPDVPDHWRTWTSLVRSDARTGRLKATEILEAGRQSGLVDWAAWMLDRYRLENG